MLVPGQVREMAHRGQSRHLGTVPPKTADHSLSLPLCLRHGCKLSMEPIGFFSSADTMAQIMAEQEVENLSGLSTNPEKDIFVVRENGTTCLMAEFAAKFIVPYDVWASNYVDVRKPFPLQFAPRAPGWKGTGPGGPKKTQVSRLPPCALAGCS